MYSISGTCVNKYFGKRVNMKIFIDLRSVFYQKNHVGLFFFNKYGRFVKVLKHDNCLC